MQRSVGFGIESEQLRILDSRPEQLALENRIEPTPFLNAEPTEPTAVIVSLVESRMFYDNHIIMTNEPK